MTRIIEVAKFQAMPGREEALVREHRGAMAALQEAFPGLLRIRLVHLGADLWADVAEWADLESATAAKEGAMAVPEFAQWTRNIVADLSLDHGIVHSAVEGERSAA